jgi:hypothetical protein
MQGHRHDGIPFPLHQVRRRVAGHESSQMSQQAASADVLAEENRGAGHAPVAVAEHGAGHVEFIPRFPATLAQG